MSFYCFISGEPNNDSPLNTQAATLWDNQKEYKRVLHEKYEAEAKKSSSQVEIFVFAKKLKKNPILYTRKKKLRKKFRIEAELVQSG